ncbi:MAG TPA: LD-carboxypeptidase [Syntrophorhabdaceae bacterium]|nr:LD-carboxypeptidase [Syntrophorhabdaceae bacterium]
MKAVKPKALKRGDKICIVSPASPTLTESCYERGSLALKSMGFNVTAGRYVHNKHLLFAGEAQKRADDINAAFQDKSVKAIFCSRGGTGTSQILPYIDFSIVRDNPKIFVGYSDITAIEIAIFNQTGLVTFYGPMVSTDFGKDLSPYTRNNFLNAITETEKPLELTNPVNREILTVCAGKAEGLLAGGCLSIAAATLGTAYELDTRDKILFFEDVDEKPHRIDRYLMQLILAGKLQQAKGIIFGTFTRCSYLKRDAYQKYGVTLMDIIKDRITSLNIPCIFGLAFGHVTKKLTIPVGARAVLDATEGRVIIKPAVQ